MDLPGASQTWPPHQQAEQRPRRGVRKGGFSLVLYDFRHTFATRMAEAGVDLATLAAILGHASIRIVQRYVSQVRQELSGSGRVN